MAIRNNTFALLQPVLLLLVCGQFTSAIATQDVVFGVPFGSGRSDFIAIALSAASSTDNASITTAQTPYFVIQYRNAGTTTIPASSFYNRLILDGATLTTKPNPSSLTFGGVSSLELGFASSPPLPAGTHVAEAILDVLNNVNETGVAGGESNNSKTRHFLVTATSGSDLAPLFPVAAFGINPSWPDRLVISTVAGASTDAATILPTNTLYVDSFVMNYGPVTTTSGFTTRFKLDGNVVPGSNRVYPTGLGQFQGAASQDVAVSGPLNPGLHTLTLEIDTLGQIAEADEGNNTYSRTFTVSELQSGDYTYAISNNAITITGYSGAGGAVAIPATIAGLPVTRIGTNAFDSRTTLTSVTLPNSVTNIGSQAFIYCFNLTNVIFGNGVTTIEDSAFYDCRKLVSITLADNVTSLGGFAFAGCSSLTNIALSANVTSIGGAAFSGCTKLTNITVAAANATYGSVAGVLFDRNVTTLIALPGGRDGGYSIPDSVTGIGDYAFSYCTNLASMTIPDRVTSLGAYAFNSCTSLRSLMIGGGIHGILDEVFSGCTNLASVTFRGSVPDNVGMAFDNRPNLARVTIESSVTSIGALAFGTCYNLSEVTIGDSVVTIGSSAFIDCTSLTNIALPDSLTSLGESAFYNCSLQSVTLPDSVITIGGLAFGSCNSMRFATIGNGVTSIGGETFYDCANMTSVTIGNSVTHIGSGAFRDCFSLTSITFPDSVLSIGSDALLNCAALKSITFGDGLTSLGGFVFSSWPGLTNVTIGDGVTTISAGAFSGCLQLTSVTIGSSVTNIGSFAFQECASLTGITVDEANSAYHSVDGV